MRIDPPHEKFDIPDQINGIAMQAFAAGRAECNLTRTPVPTLYLDYQAQFAAVNILLGCREMLCADSIEFPDITVEAKTIVQNATLNDCFEPEFWKELRWFALVEPDKDILPVRAKFGKNSDPTLAWNVVSSKQPFWTTGLDLIASKLLTGKPVKILKAFLVQPRGIQAGVTPIKLCGQLDVNPLCDDLSAKLVELRSQIKAKEPHLAAGLKVAANSAAFGLFCQLDVKDLRTPSPLRVFSGEVQFTSPPDKVYEEPAEYYFPAISSLVTGGSHLLCAMLERMVRDMGGFIAAMDTDSAMIVSTRDGGLVPCAGGPLRLRQYHLISGHSAIRALSFAQVDEIRKRFESLNPWRKTLGVPFLKLEPENFGADGERLQLYAFCVSSKLYALYNLQDNRLVIRKPSGHGLGYLQPPYTVAEWERQTGRKWTDNLPPWIFEAWHFIISRELGFPCKRPPWLDLPAVMIVPMSSPTALKQLGNFRSLRPFNSVMVPFPRKEPNVLWKGCFVMPYTAKLNDLHGRPLVNVVSGATFYIHDRPSPKPPGWLSLRTMEDEISHILSRCEAKFCTPNGSPVTSSTIGLLVRRHIIAGEFHFIGKEASTRWSSGPDLSMMAEAGALDPLDETFREYERVVDTQYLQEIRIQAKLFSTKALSRRSAVAECAIRSFKQGKNTIRPRTLRKLTRAIHDLQNRQPDA